MMRKKQQEAEKYILRIRLREKRKRKEEKKGKLVDRIRRNSKRT